VGPSGDDPALPRGLGTRAFSATAVVRWDGNAEVLVWELESGSQPECTLTCNASATPDTGGAPLATVHGQVVAYIPSRPATLWDPPATAHLTEPNPSHTYGRRALH
jgi:hypothetical protein